MTPDRDIIDEVAARVRQLLLAPSRKNALAAADAARSAFAEVYLSYCTAGEYPGAKLEKFGHALDELAKVEPAGPDVERIMKNVKDRAELYKQLLHKLRTGGLAALGDLETVGARREAPGE